MCQEGSAAIYSFYENTAAKWWATVGVTPVFGRDGKRNEYYFGGKQITRDEAVDFFKKAMRRDYCKKERLR